MNDLLKMFISAILTGAISTVATVSSLNTHISYIKDQVKDNKVAIMQNANDIKNIQISAVNR